VGVLTTRGDFMALIREGKEIPGMTVTGMAKPGPYGLLVARISEARYQRFLAGRLERVEIDPNNIQAEIDKTQGEIDYNLVKCIVGAAGCAGGGLLAIGSGGGALALAGIACFQAYTTCEDLDKANVALFQKREELKKRLKEEAAEKDNESADSRGDGGGGGGGAVGGGGQGGWYGPGTPGGSYTGSVTVTQAPPGPMPGAVGGGVGRRPILQ
jgi:hypothetical protein